MNITTKKGLSILTSPEYHLVIMKEVVEDIYVRAIQNVSTGMVIFQKGELVWQDMDVRIDAVPMLGGRICKPEEVSLMVEGLMTLLAKLEKLKITK